jgi:hypothetical protein
MKALVKKYESCNELTYVSINDEVMKYDDSGYERLGNVVEIFIPPENALEALITVEYLDDNPETIIVDAQMLYSENEMSEEQYEQALVDLDFSREDSKLPMHVRTTLIDGSEAHFFEENVIEYADSFSCALRSLLDSRNWENSQL